MPITSFQDSNKPDALREKFKHVIFIGADKHGRETRAGPAQGGRLAMCHAGMAHIRRPRAASKSAVEGRLYYVRQCAIVPAETGTNYEGSIKLEKALDPKQARDGGGQRAGRYAQMQGSLPVIWL